MTFFKLMNNSSKSKVSDKLSEIDHSLSILLQRSEELSTDLKSNSKANRILEEEINLKKQKQELMFFQVDNFKEELENLSTEKKKYEEELKNLIIAITSAESGLSLKSSEKENISSHISHLEQEVREKKANIEHANDEIKNYEDQLITLNAERDQLVIEVEELEILSKNQASSTFSKKDQIGFLAKDCAEKRELISLKTNEINEIKKQIDIEEKTWNTLNLELSNLSSEENNHHRVVQGLKEELFSLDQKNKRTEQLLQEIRHDAELSLGDVKNIQETVQERNKELQNKAHEVTNLEKSLKESTAKYNELHEEIKKIEKNQQELESRSESLTLFLNQTNQKVLDYQNRSTELEIELSGLVSDQSLKEQELSRLQSIVISLERNLDKKNQESDDLHATLKRLNSEVDKTSLDTEAKKTALIKVESSISSLRDQLSIQSNKLEEYTEKRAFTSEELELAQEKFEILSQEVKDVYRLWTDEKVSYENFDRKLSIVIGECNALSQKVAKYSEDRENISRESHEAHKEVVRKTQKRELLSSELENLISETKKLTEVVSSLSQKNESLTSFIFDLSTEISIFDEQKSKLESRFIDLSKENNFLDIKYKNKLDEEKSLFNKLASLKEKNQSLDVEKSKKEDELSLLGERILVVESDLTSAENKIIEYGKMLAGVKETSIEKRAVLDGLKQKLTTLDSASDGIVNEIRVVKSEIDKLDSECLSINDKLVSLTQAKKNHESHLGDLKDKKSILIREKNEKSEDLEALDKQISLKQEEIRFQENEASIIVQDLNEKRKSITDGEIKLQALGHELETLGSSKLGYADELVASTRLLSTLEEKIEDQSKKKFELIKVIGDLKDKKSILIREKNEKSEDLEELNKQILLKQEEVSFQEHEVSIIVQDFNEKRKSITDGEIKLQALGHELETLGSSKLEYADELVATSRLISSLEEKIEDQSKKKFELIKVIGDLKDKKSILTREKNEKCEDLEELVKQISLKQEEIRFQENEARVIVQDLNEKRKSIADGEIKLQALGHELETLGSSKLGFADELVASTRLLSSLEEKVEEQSKKKFELKKVVGELQDSVSALKGDISQKEKSINELQMSVDELNVTLISSKEKYAKVNATLVEKNKNLQSLNQKKNVLLSDVNLKKIELDQKEKRLEEFSMKINDQEKANELLILDIESLKSEILDLEECLKAKSTEDFNADKIRFGLVAQVDELEKQKNFLASKVRVHSQKNSDFNNLKTTFNAEKANLEKEIVKLELSLNKLTTENLEFQKINEVEIIELKELRKKQSVMTSDIELKKQQLTFVSHDYSSLSNEKTKLRKKIAEFTSLEKKLLLDHERIAREKFLYEEEIVELKKNLESIGESVKNKKVINDEMTKLFDSYEKEKVTLTAKQTEMIASLKPVFLDDSSNVTINKSQRLFRKLEELASEISITIDLVTVQLDDNKCTREFLTIFYSNLNKLIDQFENVDHIIFDCGRHGGKIQVKGTLKQAGLKTDSQAVLKNEITKCFSYLKESQLSEVKVGSGVMIINYQDQSLDTGLRI